LSLKKVVYTTLTGKLIIRRRYKPKVELDDIIIIRKNNGYRLKFKNKSFRVVFDDESILEDLLNGLWIIERVELLKSRRRLQIRFTLKREVKVEDKPKTALKLNKGIKDVEAIVFKGNKIIDKRKFRIRKNLAYDIVEYAKKFKKPVIVSEHKIPKLDVIAALNGINVVSFYSPQRNLRLKPLIIGLILIIALTAVAMVYYSSFGIATITVEKKVDVTVNIKGNVVVYAPGMCTKKIGFINTTVYGDPADYRLIIQLAHLETHCGCEVIAVQIYEGTDLKGIITPLTPALIIEEDESKNYTVEIFYLAITPCRIKIALQASVELI